MPSALRMKIWTLCGPAPLVVWTAAVSGSWCPEAPEYGSSLMFLKPQTKLDLRTPSRRFEESDTALRLWLALQVSPSRSPRACSQKIAFFCSRACVFASSREESQLTSLVSRATFFSTLAPGTRALLAAAGCAFLAFFFCADAG